MEKVDKRAVKPEDKLIRFEGKTFKIASNAQKEFTLIEVTEDDLAEFLVLGTLKDMYHVSLEKVIEHVRDEQLKSAEASLKEIACKAMGFDNRWGKWEVDHCNSRQSDLGTMIGQQVKDFIKAQTSDINIAFTEEERSMLKIAVVQEYNKGIHEYLRSYECRQFIQKLVVDTLMEQTKDYIKRHVVDFAMAQLGGKKFSAGEIVKGMTFVVQDDKAVLKKSEEA